MFKPAFSWIFALPGLFFTSLAQEVQTAPLTAIDPRIEKIVAEISGEKIATIMRRLGSFETRHTLSDPTQTNRGIGAARQWIFDEFKSYSPRLEVRFDTHEIKKTNRVYKDVELRNVVALLPGAMAAASNRWIIIGGHYDTVNLKVPADLRGQNEKIVELIAPGVSDDASGVACAMECARVFSQYEFDATIAFVAFAGEEQGLLGSRALAKRLKAERIEIEAVLNNDIIGNEVAGNGTTDNRRVLLFSEDPNDSGSRQLARFIRSVAARYYPEMAVDLIFRSDRFGRAGDHTSFNREGYAGVRFTTANEHFANQHSPTDTFENASPVYATKVTKVNAAAAAALALAPRTPVTRNSRGAPLLTRGSGYDAVLRWEHTEAEPDLAGFSVLMRSTTSPDWEREIWVGNTREWTFKNVPIDQVVLGVKAVDQRGHESLAAAYVTQPFSVRAEPRLISAKKIWDAAPHNAFTDLIRHNDEWLCVFREGAGHVSPDGKIRVIVSKDGQEWTSAALIAQADRDLRDPKITLAPDGQLMIYAAAADRPKTPVTHQSMVWFSKDGRNWSDGLDVADKNVWLWRLAWNKGVGIGIGYDTSGEKFVRLYKTTDGKVFETLVDRLQEQESPNETGLAFDKEGNLFCLLRRDGKPGNGLLGIAKPPYTDWTWKDVGAKIGGPQLVLLPDGRFIGGVRLYDGGARTSVVSIDRDTGALTELLKLPSGGDTSYPGVVWFNNELWVSYYSSHEGKTMIYLARVGL
jgi:hypothetical protein